MVIPGFHARISVRPMLQRLLALLGLPEILAVAHMVSIIMKMKNPLCLPNYPWSDLGCLARGHMLSQYYQQHSPGVPSMSIRLTLGLKYID